MDKEDPSHQEDTLHTPFTNTYWADAVSREMLEGGLQKPRFCSKEEEFRTYFLFVTVLIKDQDEVFSIDYSYPVALITIHIILFIP